MPWFDCATRRPISANTGGMLSPNLGLVLHHQAGNGSLYGFFNNPASQVSAHFWVSKTGQIEQYVDTNVVSWHGRSLNSRYVGMETEGCASAPYAEPMTEAMINAIARIYKEGAQRHGWKNALANADGQPGFGYHRMGVNTACPCDVRLNKRQDILNRAFDGAPTPVPPTPEPTDEEIVMVSDVISFRGQAHCFQTASGQLWHKWTLDNGGKWMSEPLIRPSGGPVTATVKDGVSASVVDNMMYCMVEDNKNMVWMSRQGSNPSDGWDIRQVP